MALAGLVHQLEERRGLLETVVVGLLGVQLLAGHLVFIVFSPLVVERVQMVLVDTAVTLDQIVVALRCRQVEEAHQEVLAS